MTGHVFISYSRQDGDWAQELARALEAEGAQVWIDRSSIPASVPWREEIRHAVRGALVFVVVDTAASRVSVSCAEERAIADQLGKPVVMVDPTVIDAVGGVVAVMTSGEALEDTDVVSADLLARSSRWHSAGRRRSALAAGKTLSAYLASSQSNEVVRADAEAGEFVRRSRRRRRRLRLATGAGALGLVLLIVAASLLRGLGDELATRFADQQAATQNSSTLAAAVEAQPRSALPEAIAALRASGELTYETAMLTSRIIDTRLPHTAGQAVVTDRSQPRSAGWMVEVDPEGRFVDVLDPSSTLQQRVRLSGKLAGMAWDRDQSNLAISDGRGIGVYDVVTGRRWLNLASSTTATDLEFTPEGDLAGTTDGEQRRVWSTSPGAGVAGDRDWWFMDSAAAADGRTGLLTRDGIVVEVDEKGEEARRIAQVPEQQALSIASFRGGWLVGGTEVLWEVAAGGEDVTRIETADCLVVDIVERRDGDVAFACRDSSYGVWTPGSSEVSRVPTEVLTIDSVNVIGEDLILAGGSSEFARITGGGTEEFLRLGREGCLGGSREVAVAPSGRFLFSAGVGIDNSCLERLTLTGDTAETNLLPPLTTGGHESRAIAVSPDEKFVAVGSSAGDIHVFDCKTLNLLQVTRVAGQEIRGLEFTDGGRNLVAATRGGEVRRIPVTAGATLEERTQAIEGLRTALPAD